MPRAKKIIPKNNQRNILIGVVVVGLASISIGLNVWKNFSSAPYSVSTARMMPGVVASPMMASGKGLAINDTASYNPNAVRSESMMGSSITIPRQKITQGSLSLIVDNVETTVDSIKTIANDVGGFTSNSNISELDNRTIIGTITVRVPADQFDETMTELKKLAVKVDSESTGIDDVTDQVIDIQARIKNLQLLETQYRQILTKATKIDDIVNITNQINQVQSQIESLQGQLKYLGQSVDMATISVNLQAVADVQVFGLTWKPLIIVKQALRDMVAGFISYIETIIRIVFYLPVLILWLFTGLIVIAFGYGVVREFYRRIKKII